MSSEPTYAVLGSTGNCGAALIENLLDTPNAKINAYCRNKLKLITNLPQVAENKRVKIFEGSIDNEELMAQCLRGTRAVFHVVSTNDNVPGCHVGMDTARCIIAGLERLKRESQPGLKLPKIVLLSSATIDDHLSRHMPWWFRPVMRAAASNVYEDLRVTERFLRSHEDWVTTIFIKPGGLSVDIKRGHKLDMDHEESFISYLDLSAAMIEAADDPEGRYDMKNVGVVNKNGAAKFPSGTPMVILTGLLRHFFPFLHPYLPSGGP